MREIAHKYQEWSQGNDMDFITEQFNTRANYWLNAVIMQDKQQRDRFIEVTNSSNITTRPVWLPMLKLAINQDCQKNEMTNTEWLSERLVNVPSSVNIKN